MADGFVGLDPDGTGKKVDMSELLVGGVSVERERMVLSDNTDPLAFAAIKNVAPGLLDYGLTTRIAGTVDVSGSAIVAVTGGLTDAQLRALAVPVSGPLTDAQLRALAVPVSGPLTDAQLRALAVPVSGTFFQATQPISAVTLPLPAGASTEATLATRLTESVFNTKTGDVTEAAPASDTASSGLNGRLQRIAQRLTSLIALLPAALGQKTMANSLAITLASDQSTLPAVAEARAATLHVTGTAAVNTAVTLTLPAPGAGLFHYITSIQVLKKYSVIGVAGAGPILTSTNLPGNPQWDTEHLAAPANTVTKVLDYSPSNPLRSAVANTATTIVCPLQLQTIWRVNVSYFTGP